MRLTMTRPKASKKQTTDMHNQEDLALQDPPPSQLGQLPANTSTNATLSTATATTGSAGTPTQGATASGMVLHTNIVDSNDSADVNDNDDDYIDKLLEQDTTFLKIKEDYLRMKSMINSVTASPVIQPALAHNASPPTLSGGQAIHPQNSATKKKKRSVSTSSSSSSSSSSIIQR